MPRRLQLDDQAIVAAYLAGASAIEVAQQFGISASTVRSRLRQAQVPIRPQKRWPTAPASSADHAAIRAAYQGGETIVALAARFGIARQGVSQALRAAGVLRRPRPPRRRGTP